MDLRDGECPCDSPMYVTGDCPEHDASTKKPDIQAVAVEAMNVPWVYGMTMDEARELAKRVLDAVYPLIEAEVREQISQELRKAEDYWVRCANNARNAGFSGQAQDDTADAYHQAAYIARERPA